MFCKEVGSEIEMLTDTGLRGSGNHTTFAAFSCTAKGALVSLLNEESVASHSGSTTDVSSPIHVREFEVRGVRVLAISCLLEQ